MIVTGGSGGLGTAVVEAFREDGWRVVAPTRTDADLFDPAAVERVVAEASADPAAPLRAVANLVGGFCAAGRVHETPIEDFEAQLRVNLRPTYLVSAAALPRLIAGGGGAIVCVSTRAALRPFSGAAGYISAKAAVLAFVEALAVEYKDDDVRANAILPSVIDTPANRAAQPDADHGKWVEPEAIAEVVRFLCSPASGPVSGAQVPVYGRA